MTCKEMKRRRGCGGAVKATKDEYRTTNHANEPWMSILRDIPRNQTLRIGFRGVAIELA